MAHVARGERLIPARAGNTAGPASSEGLLPAHPRSRGEHSQYPSSNAALLGSSPLARGTHAHSHSFNVSSRLIPARAGNTCRSSSRSNGCSAHPRSRGEHRKQPTKKKISGGSSPLARGTPTLINEQLLDERLIPARAGNTRGANRRRNPCSAHPRSRGEHAGVIATAILAFGSSPLARGTHKAAEKNI